MTAYTERRQAGHYDAPTEPEAEPEADEAETTSLPRTHADLDALAEHVGHKWSGEDLTVAEKQTELGG